MNLKQLVTALRSNELDLIDYIDQLEDVFAAREADILAFVPEDGRFERLRAEAQGLLDAYPNPETRPPLFGLPIGVKDIFHVEGFTTRAGSNLPPDTLQDSEAPCVTILRDAGALILGKTVTTEFAYFGPGPTRNPHNPAHTPGGSSSGSAAAVGGGLAPLALGTQTIGSVNRPAAFCGAVGYKPSFDRIDKTSVIPVSQALDHVGIFTPTTAGLNTIARLLCDNWDISNLVYEQPLVLGIPEGPYLEQAEPEGLAHFRETCEKLRELGYTVKSVSAMADFDDIYDRHQRLMAAEMAIVHANWYEQFKDLYHPKTLELIERGQPVTIKQLTDARRSRLQLRAELQALMDEHHLDAWIAPTAPGVAPQGLESTGNPVMNLPWTQSGLPAVNIPTGVGSHNLPLSMQFVGRWYEDEELIAAVQEIEKKLQI